MSVSDRWVGMGAGGCGCGAALMWVKVSGSWVVVHEDVRADAACVTTTAPTNRALQSARD
jgi:hypothetical protein